MNYLANILTVSSLIFGFISIIFSLEAHFTFASWAIIIAVIFDGLDGQIARINPLPSEFGKELDSLADVVSFGIAPSVLGYIFLYQDFYFWAACALFIYLLCSVMRLARYNITAKEKMANYFYGLPTTVSGGALSAFILIFRDKADVILLPAVSVAFICTVLVLSFFMISKVRYLNLNGIRQLLAGKAKAAVLSAFFILALALFFDKAGIALFASFLIYLLFSPFTVKLLKS